MAINEFSALIQLSATISIAFVAVEYVKSYTEILCKNLFKFHEFVKTSFEECKNILTDSNTLEHITPMNVNGKSTNSVIEEVKRKNESLTKEITNTEIAKIEEVTVACQARSISSICLFLFLFNILLLFLGGIESSYPVFSHTSAVILCLCALIYVIIGWLFGESDKPIKLCDFSSLHHTLIIFFIIFILSIIVAFFAPHYNKIITSIECVWPYFIIFGVLCPYINFIIFIAKIWHKAKKFKKDVTASKEILKDKCTKAREVEDDLLAAYRIEERLKI